MFGHLNQPFTLILGLGESGLAMANWCHTHGCRIRVADTRATPNNLTKLPQKDTVEFMAGVFSPSLLQDIQLIGVSPGLSIHEPSIAALLEQARQQAIPVWGEIEFFAQALLYLNKQQHYTPRIIAITGTNGKTTVTQLTGKICAQAGKRVAIAGNISPAALDKLSACIADQTYPDIWVLELSSFQLATTHSLNPDVATVLNLSEDHLDWHTSFEEYKQAKAKIFGAKTIQILNREESCVMAMAKPTNKSVTFGLDEPRSAGDFGVLSENDMSWLAYAENSADGQISAKGTRQNKKNWINSAIRIQRLMPSEALAIRGRHNILNALCSLALARALDLPFAGLLHGLRAYQGEPHRLQSVAIVHDVEYIDDSKGTNVGATLAALDAIGADKKIILIAGGVAKGQDFSPLAATIARTARAVLLIGQDGQLIKQTLEKHLNHSLLLELCATLAEAVQRAAELAQAGDAVLLSPACASFDMFRDYKERAQCFIDAVRDLKIAAGEVL